MQSLVININRVRKHEFIILTFILFYFLFENIMADSFTRNISDILIPLFPEQQLL